MISIEYISVAQKKKSARMEGEEIKYFVFSFLPVSLLSGP
jgi:hypothetical protein